MNIKNKSINSLRILSANMIEKAKSGHPGVALGAAPVFYSLYADIMNYNPKNPTYFNRDRFVISAGHASSLAYATLNLFGFDISVEDLKGFRSINSITPGHPEVDLTPGVDCSTGPLGQGIANAVGMAMAGKHMAAKYNKPKFKIIDNYVYCFTGDGCLMEGVALEAISLAGNLKLNNLILIYDRNNITIEGSLDIAVDENIERKFKALNYNVLNVKDVNDTDAFVEAVKKAKLMDNKPSIIIVDSKIGYGSEWEGTAKSHGTPLSRKQIDELQKNLGYKVKPFEIKADVAKHGKKIADKKEKETSKWGDLLTKYSEKYPQEYIDLVSSLNNDYYDNAINAIKNLNIEENLPSRSMSYEILQVLKNTMPNLIGGAADVAPSTKAYFKGETAFSANNYAGRNIHFGIREHAMAAACNGMALYGGLKVFNSCYLSFSDYMKASIRMSAQMNLPNIYIFTHDSLIVGEDGPTHQPIEQLVSLRATPNMYTFRPFNFEEIKAAYIVALKANRPTAIVCTRQTIEDFNSTVNKGSYGGYIFKKEAKKLDAVIFASGSEVELALKAQEKLLKDDIDVRIVSMPCMELFEEQTAKYRNSVLAKTCNKRVSIEAGSEEGWHKYTGMDGLTIAMNSFGKSGNAQQLRKEYGFTVEAVVSKVKKYLKK